MLQVNGKASCFRFYSNTAVCYASQHLSAALLVIYHNTALLPYRVAVGHATHSDPAVRRINAPYTHALDGVVSLEELTSGLSVLCGGTREEKVIVTHTQ
jgi:hypothetical protein